MKKTTLTHRKRLYTISWEIGFNCGQQTIVGRLEWKKGIYDYSILFHYFLRGNEKTPAISFTYDDTFSRTMRKEMEAKVLEVIEEDIADIPPAIDFDDEPEAEQAEQAEPKAPFYRIDYFNAITKENESREVPQDSPMMATIKHLQDRGDLILRVELVVPRTPVEDEDETTAILRNLTRQLSQDLKSL